MENEVNLKLLKVELSDNVDYERETNMRVHLNDNSSVGIFSESPLVFEDNTASANYDECLVMDYYRTNGLVICDAQTDPISCQCRCHGETDMNKQELYRGFNVEFRCSFNELASSMYMHTNYDSTDSLETRFSNYIETGLERQGEDSDSNSAFDANTDSPPDYDECLITDYYKMYNLLSYGTQTDRIFCQCRCHSEAGIYRHELYINFDEEPSCGTGYTPFGCTQPIPDASRYSGEFQNIGYQEESVPAPFGNRSMHDSSGAIPLLNPNSAVDSTGASPFSRPNSTVDNTRASPLPHHNSTVDSTGASPPPRPNSTVDSTGGSLPPHPNPTFNIFCIRLPEV